MKVLLSHAGVQYSYQIALALQENGFLSRFWTTIYSADGGVSAPRWQRRYLSKRHYAGLDEKYIRSYAWPEIRERALQSLLRWGPFSTSHLVHWRNREFDRRVARAMKDESFDIFIGLSGATLESLKEAGRLGKKKVVDQHDIHYTLAAKLLGEEKELCPEFAASMPYWPPMKAYLDCVQKELNEADFILVPSSFALKSHLEAGIPKEKMVLLFHGLNANTPRAAAPRAEHPRFRVLYLGTLTQRKGVKYLLEAFKQLAWKDAELWLVGDCMVPKKALKPYEGFFHYEPYVPHSDLSVLFASADVLVQPSVYDAFGLSALDAMATGLPVIVSENTAAGSDVVRDGFDGFVVKIRDVEAIKDRLSRLRESQDLRKRLGERAAERAREFSWEVYRTRVREAMEKVVT